MRNLGGRVQAVRQPSVPSLIRGCLLGLILRLLGIRAVLLCLAGRGGPLNLGLGLPLRLLDRGRLLRGLSAGAVRIGRMGVCLRDLRTLLSQNAAGVCGRDLLNLGGDGLLLTGGQGGFRFLRSLLFRRVRLGRCGLGAGGVLLLRGPRLIPTILPKVL